MAKNILIKDDGTKVLFNKVKGLIISLNPDKRVTDEIAIKILLEEYHDRHKN